MIISAAEGWYLTVPDDDAELLAELRRHGITAGQRLHIVASSPVEPTEGTSPGPGAGKVRTLTYAGMGRTDEAISDDVEAHLSGFGR